MKLALLVSLVCSIDAQDLPCKGLVMQNAKCSNEEIITVGKTREECKEDCMCDTSCVGAAYQESEGKCIFSYTCGSFLTGQTGYDFYDVGGCTTSDRASCPDDSAVSSTPSCPNDGWVYNSDVLKCVPAEGQVTIECNADNMVVTLRHKQIYVLMDETHLNNATSAAMPGDCTTTKSVSEDGVYTVTIPLDDCGTDVTQANDTITFSNTISGEDAALAIDGIIVTDPLTLEVACEYPDSFDLTFGNIAVEAGVHTMDSVSMQGSFTSEFTLTSYVNEDRTTEASATNGITIGNTVYNRVEVNGTLPSNVEYVVTDCKAHPIVEDEVNHDIGYDIIKDGCMDVLLNAGSEELKGNDTNDVDFDFNGFTFSSSMNTLYLECTIILCALNSDGSFMDSECGYQYGGDDCATFDESKTLNYQKAPEL